MLVPVLLQETELSRPIGRENSAFKKKQFNVNNFLPLCSLSAYKNLVATQPPLAKYLKSGTFLFAMAPVCIIHCCELTFQQINQVVFNYRKNIPADVGSISREIWVENNNKLAQVFLSHF